MGAGVGIRAQQRDRSPARGRGRRFVILPKKLPWARSGLAKVPCQDGFRLSLGWLQRRALGHQDIRLLDGGWGGWDRAFTLPVVKGEEPYDEAFAL